MKRLCSFCGTRLKVSDKVCSHCKRKQPRWKNFLWIFLFIVVLGVIAIASNRETPKEAVPTSIKNIFDSPTINPQGEGSNKDKNNKVKITVLKAETYLEKSILDEKLANLSNMLKDKEFIKIKVKLKNDTSNELSFSYSNFRLKSSKGYISNVAMQYTANSYSISEGSVAPGGEFEGYLYFENAQPSKRYYLLYENEGMFNKNDKQEVSFDLVK